MLEEYLNNPEIGWVLHYVTSFSELVYTKEGYIDGNIGASIKDVDKYHAIPKNDDLLENLIANKVILYKNGVYPRTLYVMEDGKIAKEISFSSMNAWEEAFGKDWEIRAGLKPRPKSPLSASTLNENQKFMLDKMINASYTIVWESGCFHSDITLKAPSKDMPHYRADKQEDYDDMNELIEEGWLDEERVNTRSTTSISIYRPSEKAFNEMLAIKS